jgi:cytochrome c oxidase cbb3-type subunit 3/ubiquinol-cytochrome c reductase cytochrome c subunit
MRLNPWLVRSFLLGCLCSEVLAGVGCGTPPGKPGPEPEVPRPDEVIDFATLYKTNCVACHGDSHLPGAAISLANPVFLAVAGEDHVKAAIANGVPGKLMPAFGKGAGGMLTDRQVDILAKGILSAWGKPGLLDGQSPPPYAATLKPDASAGGQPYAAYCARCHGASGEGNKEQHVGSIVDPAYLALISDQELRNIVIAGVPGMPDWRSDTPGHPMADAQITNIVAWLGSHREASAAVPNPPGPAPKPGSSTANKPTHAPSGVR